MCREDHIGSRQPFRRRGNEGKCWRENVPVDPHDLCPLPASQRVLILPPIPHSGPHHRQPNPYILGVQGVKNPGPATVHACCNPAIHPVASPPPPDATPCQTKCQAAGRLCASRPTDRQPQLIHSFSTCMPSTDQVRGPVPVLGVPWAEVLRPQCTQIPLEGGS